MPPTTCSRLCSRDSALKSIFASSTISSASSASFIVSARCHLLLFFFFNVKPFSFTRSIDVQSKKSGQFINSWGANVSPSRTPATMSIGFTLLYFEMDVMPLVSETKMADVSILISLGNLFARRTTWLGHKTTSATSIFSRVLGAYYMTRIFYKYSNLLTLTLFFTISLGKSTQLFFTIAESTPLSLSHFHLQSRHTLSSVTSRENTLTLSISTNRVNTLFLFLRLTSSSQPPQKWMLSATILFLVILFR